MDAPPRLEWLGHATVLLDLGGARLLTDPVLRPRVAHLLRRGTPPAVPGRVDAVLLSHLHRDHADVPSLRRLAADTPVIGPRGSAPVARRAGLRDVREVVVGDRVEITDGVTVHAVPARHETRRDPFGARTDAVGYVVAGPRRVYFAGDTDVFAGMRRLGDLALDLALLPIWGWGTRLGPGHMDPEAAARAVALLQPALAVPIHWGTFLPIGAGRRNDRLLEDPARDFALHASRSAPAVRVVVLCPHERLEL